MADSDDPMLALRAINRVMAEHSESLDLLEAWMERSRIPKGRSNPNHCRLCDEPDTLVNRAIWRAACPHHRTEKWIADMRKRLEALRARAPRVDESSPEVDPASLTD